LFHFFLLNRKIKNFSKTAKKTRTPA